MRLPWSLGSGRYGWFIQGGKYHTMNANVALVLGSLIGLAGTIFAVWMGRKKTDAETSAQISAAWRELIAPYRSELDQLHREVEALRQRERILYGYIEVLRGILKPRTYPPPAGSRPSSCR